MWSTDGGSRLSVAWVRFQRGVIRVLSFLLVLVLLRGFFSGRVLQFSARHKTNISKFQFEQRTSMRNS